MSQRRQQQQAREAAQETTRDPWILAAGASVVLSWIAFFGARDRELGLFIGLWPPTFLAFASYFNQTRMQQMLNRATGQGGIVERVEQMVQGR